MHGLPVCEQLPLTLYLPNAMLPHIDKLLAMVRHPKVALKVRCLPFYSTESYPSRGMHHDIRNAFDAFGPKRFFWGTGPSRLPCTCRRGVTLFAEAFAVALRRRS